jgi:hypothetical protein
MSSKSDKTRGPLLQKSKCPYRRVGGHLKHRTTGNGRRATKEKEWTMALLREKEIDFRQCIILYREICWTTNGPAANANSTTLFSEFINSRPSCFFFYLIFSPPPSLSDGIPGTH